MSSAPNITENANLLSRLTLDKVILIPLFVLASLPFANILLIDFASAIFSAFELLYILIELILLLVIFSKLAIKKSNPFLIFSFVVGFYFLISVAVFDVSPIEYINQLRNFMPFIVAVTLLASGITVNLRQYMVVLSVSAVISVSSAFIIHYLFPEIIATSFEASPVVVRQVELGRMYWSNAFLLYFLIIFLYFQKNMSGPWRYLLLLSVLVCFVGVFNTLNRTVIAGLLVIFGGSMFIEKRFGGVLKRAIIISTGVSVFLLVIVAMSSVEERVRNLVELRYFGEGGGPEAIVEKSLLASRVVLYSDYLESIRNYFPVGQGLGRPYSTSFGKEYYTTDISVASFVVPFGILGLITFASFIMALYGKVNRAKPGLLPKQIVMIKVLLLSSILVSLNVDLYSRNNFVIFITMLVLALPKVARDRTPQLVEVVPISASSSGAKTDGRA